MTQQTRELTVFAAEGTVAGGEGGREAWRYYRLSDGKRLPLTDAEAAASGDWTLAFKRSMVRVNDGVTGVCALPPVEVGREAFATLTDEDFRVRFDAVSAIPDTLPLSPEGVEPAFFGWRVADGDGWKAPLGKGWKVRCADGTSFARMRVTAVDDDGLGFTLRFTFQPEKGGAMGEDHEEPIRAGEGFSFRWGESLMISAEDAGKRLDWDIRLDADGNVYTNSNVSGPGKAGVLGSNKYGAKWKELTDPSDCIVFFVDEYGSLLRTPKWYRYNIDGAHNIHPNGAVYGLRAPDGDWLVQIFDYFEHKGSDVGNFRLRYKRAG